MSPKTTAPLKSSQSDFISKVEAQWSKGRFVCIGLDSDLMQIPDLVKREEIQTHDVIFRFNKEIIDATSDLACAYKPNTAFYEANGVSGILALERTVWYLKKEYPEIPVILDAKRADIGNTNEGYVHAAFDHLGVDAVTVNPYLGEEALEPFLARKDKGIIVLVKTSNPGAGEVQDLTIEKEGQKMPLYEYVARQVAQKWNKNKNCGIVVGATYPDDLRKIREIVGDMPILIPGLGAQGGETEATVNAGKDSKGMGMIINSSRGIIFASKADDFAEAAYKRTKELHDQITSVL